MSDTLSRRELLQAAGGITFLSLLPVGALGFAAPVEAAAPGKTPAAPLLYTATPYVQPGDASQLVEGQESVVIAWQTEARPANFTVEYGYQKSYSSKAIITRTQPYSNKNENDLHFNYAATLSGLKLGTKYDYRVSQDGTIVAEGYFTTRKPRKTSVRFVAFGDNSFGEVGQRGVAYHAYKANPDFVMNTGDNVYEGGLNNEYIRYFFPIYNADIANSSIGAPLLRSVPFYTVIANHDVHGKDADGHPAADFGKEVDSLGYYSLLHLPANGLSNPPQPTTVTGPAAAISQFKEAVGTRFPRQATYSFDYGDCHFLCLDSNIYVDTTDNRWADFIEKDLFNTDAKWKFVVYHHPAYNVGDDHYSEQHMRLFSPLFEKHRVDFVLSGHEHNYQRTKPFFFSPAGNGGAANVNTKKRLVPGAFTVDEHFDGKTVTKAGGVIYIVTGAGGKHLYDPGFTDNPAKWLHEEDKNAPYCAKVVTDRHSFTLFEISGSTLILRQIDQFGQEIDRIRVTKA